MNRLWVYLAPLLVMGVPQAAAAECKSVEMPDGNASLFCKDKAGKWRQQEGDVVTTSTSVSAPGAPRNVDATFQGTYSVGVMPRPKSSRNATFGSLIAGAAAKPQITNQGGMTFVLRLTGEQVAGTVEPMGLGKSDLVGTMRGGVCRLMTKEATYEGRCGSSGFIGKISGTLRNGREISGQFETQTMSFEDTSQRDARRAELKAACDSGASSKACVDLEQMK